MLLGDYFLGKEDCFRDEWISSFICTHPCIILCRVLVKCYSDCASLLNMRLNS